MGGMVGLCCMCQKEVPIRPDGVRMGYCSDECWEAWLKEHKDDLFLAPYVPMQTTLLKFDK